MIRIVLIDRQSLVFSTDAYKYVITINGDAYTTPTDEKQFNEAV